MRADYHPRLFARPMGNPPRNVAALLQMMDFLFREEHAGLRHDQLMMHVFRGLELCSGPVILQNLGFVSNLSSGRFIGHLDCEVV